MTPAAEWLQASRERPADPRYSVRSHRVVDGPTVADGDGDVWFVWDATLRRVAYASAHRAMVEDRCRQLDALIGWAKGWPA